jgi:hypothetical protein
MRYVAEYDDNSCVWLVDTETKARLPLEHGTVLHILTITPPRVTLTDVADLHAIQAEVTGPLPRPQE